MRFQKAWRLAVNADRWIGNQAENALSHSTRFPACTGTIGKCIRVVHEHTTPWRIIAPLTGMKNRSVQFAPRL
jgi:hypothetical protein